MSEWISVKDRLPETHDNGYGWEESKKYPVLVTSENTGPVEGWHSAVYNKKERYDFWQIYGFLGDFVVTHWMPLPEPPEEV